MSVTALAVRRSFTGFAGKLPSSFQVTNVPDNNSDIDANNNDTPIDILDNEAGLEENAQDCEETESPPERSRERTTACRPANAEWHSRFNEEAAEASEAFPQKISQFLRRTSQLILFFLQGKQKLRTYTFSKNGIRNIHGYIMTRT